MINPRKDKYKISWENWRDIAYKEGISGISKANSDIILQYLKDMEIGMNVSCKSAKGARSPRRLHDAKCKMIIFAKKFQLLNNCSNITELKEEQIFKLFYGMKHGEIKRNDGLNYQSVDTWAKIFKAFWHWWMKINRKRGINIDDITLDLDTKQEKPKWVYLNESEVKKLANSSTFSDKVLIMFLYDTGLRPPLELLPLKVSNLSKDCKELDIQVCKKNSHPRKIKLILSQELLKSYIEMNKLKPENYLFDICPEVINRRLQRTAKKIFGEGITQAGQKYSQLTMYDFRHCSCCYWLPRYPTENALMYRFGWKKSDKIHYYSEMLGMKDTITTSDIITDEIKTEIENRMKAIENENEILKERIAAFEHYIAIIDTLADETKEKINLVGVKFKLRKPKIN